MHFSRHFKLHHWPGLTFGLFIFTFLLSYLIAVLTGHVYGFFPYISDTGTLIPESCIFGQLMNFGALSLGISFYIRYRQVDYGINSGDIDVSRKWNAVAMWLAGCIALGISLVANFQETAILAVHFIGAFMVFGIGTAYFSMQTRISYASIRKLNYTNSYQGISRKMLYFRAFLSFCLFPLLFINCICGLIAMSEFKGKSLTWWTEKDGGFKLRLASTFCEWILIIFMLLYVLTFTDEFKAIKFEEITFTNKSSTTQREAREISSSC